MALLELLLKKHFWFIVYKLSTATTVVFPSSLLVEFWEGIMKAGYSALIVVNVKKRYSFIYRSF